MTLLRLRTKKGVLSLDHLIYSVTLLESSLTDTLKSVSESLVSCLTIPYLMVAQNLIHTILQCLYLVLQNVIWDFLARLEWDILDNV